MTQRRQCVNIVCGRVFSVPSRKTSQLYCQPACKRWTGKRARRPRHNLPPKRRDL